jgi:hypothetical protein
LVRRARVRPTVHEPARFVALFSVFNVTDATPLSLSAFRAPSLTAFV